VAALLNKQHTDRTWTQALADNSKTSNVPTYKTIQMHSALKMRRLVAPKRSIQIPENTAADPRHQTRKSQTATFY
jgi:hypothetical protein